MKKNGLFERRSRETPGGGGFRGDRRGSIKIGFWEAAANEPFRISGKDEKNFVTGRRGGFGI